MDERTLKRLTEGLDDYDADTVRHLASQGASEAILERLRLFEGKDVRLAREKFERAAPGSIERRIGEPEVDPEAQPQTTAESLAEVVDWAREQGVKVSHRLVRVQDLRPEMVVESLRGLKGHWQVVSAQRMPTSDQVWEVAFSQGPRGETRTFVGTQHLAVLEDS